VEGTVAQAINGPGVEVVRVLSAFEQLPDAVRSGGVDCVVAWLGSRSLPRQLHEAHDIRPTLRIVGVVDDAHEVRVYEIRPDSDHSAELGLDRLSQLIQDISMPETERTESER
jgi:hypothetical protein